MPERKAYLPDGTVLHFPDGTKDEVIQRAVNEQLGIKNKDEIPLLSSHAAPEFERPTNEGNLTLEQLRSSIPQREYYPKKGVHLRSAIESQLISQKKGPYEKNSPQDIFDILANSVPNIRTAASTVAGTAAGVASANPVVGDVTMGAVDELLRHFTGEPSATYFNKDEPSVLPKVIEGGIESGVLNKAISGAASGLYGGAKELINKNSVINDEILKFKPTYAQLLRSRGSKWAGIYEGFENLFAPSSKTKALDQSFNLIKDEGDKWLESITGRKLGIGQSDELAEAARQGNIRQYDTLKRISTAKGDLVTLNAEHSLNREIIPIYEMKNVGIDSLGKPIIAKVKVGEKVLKGPVDYQTTVPALINLKSELYASNIKPDPDNPILKAIDDIFEGINAKFDKKGNLISYDKTDFGKAWKDKQITGKLGYDIKSLPENVQNKFKALNHAIDTDIQNSTSNWKYKSLQSLVLFNDANSIVATRNELFNPKHEVGKTIDDFINNDSGTKATFHAMLDDPKKLENFLSTNQIKLPDGRYISSNARRDAQGATIQRAFNSAEVPNAYDSTKNTFDDNKLMSFMNDPERQEALKKTFGSQNLSNIKQLFKNIAYTTGKEGGRGATRYLGLRAGSYGLSLGSGIASYFTVGRVSSSLVSGTLGVSVTLGSHALARTMTNPEAARVLLAMSQGIPLGMSAKLATRIISNSLRNQIVTVTYADGSSENLKINNLGKPVPLQREPNINVR